MKIYAINGMQSHCESVKKNVSLVGSVILRGIEIYGVIQLLEGSHRMAYAIELGLPITIVLFNENEVVPHDCDDIESPVTGLPDYATAGELARALIIERGLLMYKVAVYESSDFSNVKIIKPNAESGKTLHAQLINNSPFSAFLQKIWEVTFGELKDLIGKNVLVFGKNSEAEAFVKLGADVTFVDSAICQDITAIEADDKQYDLIYAADIPNKTDLYKLFSAYKRLLKTEGLAVTLNDEQASEQISAIGLNIYWFSEVCEKYPKVSFVRNLK